MKWQAGQTTDKDVCVLRLEGDLDVFIVDEMRRELATVAENNRHVILDLEKVRFLDSSALGVLVRTSQVSKATGGVVCLAAASPFLVRVLDTTGLNRVFPTFDTVSAAQA